MQRMYLRPSLIVAIGLIGGFAAARYTGRRELGGAVFALAGIQSARGWARLAGPGPAAALTVLYTAARGSSHPLAKRLGPWPSVLAVTAATAAASELATRRRLTSLSS
jgi:hypothetical protein